jgi:hypothetical protein
VVVSLDDSGDPIGGMGQLARIVCYEHYRHCNLLSMQFPVSNIQEKDPPSNRNCI